MTTDGEFFPLCALLSIYAKAFLAGARWNHHHDERAWEEGCCTGLPEHLGSRRADELNEQSQATPATSGPQNPSGLQGVERWLQPWTSRRRSHSFVQHGTWPRLQIGPSCWLLWMVLAPNHHLATALWTSDAEKNLKPQQLPLWRCRSSQWRLGARLTKHHISSTPDCEGNRALLTDRQSCREKSKHKASSKSPNGYKRYWLKHQ